jgi:hypothetical protein
MTEENKDLQPAAPTAPAPEAPAANSADLNVSDLTALRSIIDVASQRGAFKAGELEAVGKIYNRLSTFLDSVSKKEQ